MEGQNPVVLAFKQLARGSATTSQIKQAEKNLSILSQEDNFLLYIKQILQNIQSKENIAKIAAIYIMQYTRKIISKKDPSKINLLCEQLLQMLQSGSIPLPLKRFIGKSLQIALAADKTKVMRKTFNEKVIISLQAIAQNIEDASNIQFVALLGHVLMQNSSYTKELAQYIKVSFVPFLTIAIHLVDTASTGINEGNVAKVTKSLQCLREYTSLIKLYLKRLMISGTQVMKLLYTDEIEPLISKILNINLPSNQFSNPLFIVSKEHQQLSQIMNQVKAHAILISRSVVKILSVSVKEQPLVNINITFSKMLTYESTIIESTAKFLAEYKVQNLDRAKKQLLEQILTQIKTYATINSFYSVIRQNKDNIIQRIIFILLTFNERQLNNFSDDPEEFFNMLLHIVQRNTQKAYLKQYRQYQPNEKEKQDDQQQDDTIKTLCSELLGALCKHIDGVMNEVVKFCFMVIKGQLNTTFPKHLILTIVCLLKVQLIQRHDLLVQLYMIVKDYFNEAPLPINTSKQKKKNLQYCLMLMILTKYVMPFTNLQDSTPQTSFYLVVKVLNEEKIEQLAKFISFLLIELLSTLQIHQDEQKYPLSIVQALAKILTKSPHPSTKVLDSLFAIIKYNTSVLVKYCQIMVNLLNILTEIIKYHMESSSINKPIVNKCWNIIRQIGQSNDFIPVLIPDIQNCIIKLIHYLDTRLSQIDFEQDILLLMISFIEKSKQVTRNQLLIFQYIPKIFQHYKLTYNNTFYALQTFIYYGKDILKVSPLAIKSIIQMCRLSILTKQYQGNNITEYDNCQGVLILQSLIISLEGIFDETVWRQLAKILSQRLQMGSIQFPLLQSNIIATVGLILAKGHQSFSKQENQLMLRRVLSQLGCFQNVEFSPKVLIIALTQMLTLVQIEFIRNQFVFILDALVTLLQITSNKKSDLFKDDVEEDQERNYRNCLAFVVNNIKKVDEFQNFQSKFDILKSKYHNLLVNTVNQLPQAKKDFLKKCYATKRIQDGNARPILTIKRLS